MDDRSQNMVVSPGGGFLGRVGHLERIYIYIIYLPFHPYWPPWKMATLEGGQHGQHGQHAPRHQHGQQRHPPTRALRRQSVGFELILRTRRLASTPPRCRCAANTSARWAARVTGAIAVIGSTKMTASASAHQRSRHGFCGARDLRSRANVIMHWYSVGCSHIVS
jgi:hypothetical protein